MQKPNFNLKQFYGKLFKAECGFKMFSATSPDAADFLTNDWKNRKENIEHSCIYTFIEQ